jgi:ferredoxin--NADP+ reductase
MEHSRPLRAAVIGSGPAGVYAAEALLRADPPIDVQVDVIDALPTPFGLVRYGVAPDHFKIKSVARTLTKIMEDPRVRFIGNVAYGDDLTLDDVRAHYDAAVFATGSPHDRRLGVPGEDLPGSHAAADFVAWYSGHPQYAPGFPLGASSVAVIGAGNVALDVARVLALGSDGLAHTDVPDAALAALADHPVDDVHIIARRGPAQAKFTLVELREMAELPGTDVVVHADELEVDAAGEEAMAARRPTRSMVELFRTWAERPLTGAPRRVHFRFLHRPVEIVGPDEVTAVRLERSHLDGTGNAVGTGEVETLPAQMAIRSIGYRGSPLPGLPFDDDAATVPNDAGRVLGKDGAPLPGLYAAGWIKRGPTGVIGTNRSDATETVRSLLADAEAGNVPSAPEPAPDAVLATLRRHGTRYVTWDGWRRIDEYERELGEILGRDRAKTPDLAAMLTAIGNAAAASDHM